MFVFQGLNDVNDPPETKLRIAALGYSYFQLRNTISDISRVENESNWSCEMSIAMQYQQWTYCLADIVWG